MAASFSRSNLSSTAHVARFAMGVFIVASCIGGIVAAAFVFGLTAPPVPGETHPWLAIGALCLGATVGACAGIFAVAPLRIMVEQALCLAEMRDQNQKIISVLEGLALAARSPSVLPTPPASGAAMLSPQGG